MKQGLSIGTPIVSQADGSLWAVVTTLANGNVLTCNTRDYAWWRIFTRDSVMMGRYGIAYTVDTAEDAARVIASWHDPSGRMDDVRQVETSKPRQAPAQPRAPMRGATPRRIAA